MSRGDYDFDVRGIVRVRLVDAGPAERAVVERQLGPLGRRPDGTTPDVTVRFTDQVTTGELDLVGLGEAAANADGFFVLRGRDATRRRTLMPFADLGNRPVLVCERGVPAVPHLVTVVNLTALAKGALPMHASAFTVDDTGVLVVGWAKGGKTETLLAAMRRGARYVGDEWVYLLPDGRMTGLPEPMRLWAWQLAQLPELHRERSARQRLRLRTWSALAAGARAAARGGPAAGLAGKAEPVLGRQAYVQVPPHVLFGVDAVAAAARLDAVVLVTSHTGPAISVRPSGGHEVAERMAASLAHERATFAALYRQFRYAFPHLRSPLLEEAGDVERRLLRDRLDGRRAVVVGHPYPCSIDGLGDAVLSAVDVPSGAEVPA